MANLKNLEDELWVAQKELLDLRRDTRTFDPFKEFTSRELINADLYTDPKKATIALNKILRLQKEIRDAKIEKANPKPIARTYTYYEGTERKTTPDHALAARYNAQHRFFGMGKFKQTMAKLKGQKKKFDKLWTDALVADPEKNEQVAQQLDKLFR